MYYEMNTFQKEIFDLILRDTYKELSKKILPMAENILNYSAKKFSTVTDEKEQFLFEQLPTELAKISKRMSNEGLFISIYLNEADFFFCHMQVKAFLVITNRECDKKLARIEIRYNRVSHFAYSSAKNIAYPNSNDDLPTESSVWDVYRP